MTDAARAFETLFDAVHRSDALTMAARRRLEAELIYFVTQAKLPPDQRDPADAIKHRWTTFNTVTASAPVLARYRNDLALWRQLEAFAHQRALPPNGERAVGVNSSSESETPRSKSEHPSRAGQPGQSPPVDTMSVEAAKQDPVDFFEKLLKEVLQRPTMSEAEKLAIVSSIRYLVVEGERARGLRDHKAIKLTWDRLYPLLEKFRFLELYKDDLTLKAQIGFFVRNGFF